MNQAQLLEATREELGDETEPYLTSTRKLIRHLNEAMRQAAVRARLLVESNLPHVCEIHLKPGQARYELDRSVVFVRRAVLRSDPGCKLDRTNTADLDGHWPTWRDRTGPPEYLMVDQQGSGTTAIVAPTPEVEDIIDMTVVRYPLDVEEFEDGDDDAEPPFAAIHHEPLIHWVCWRVYNQRDDEDGNDNEANRQLGMFEQHFGPMPTAKDIQRLAIDRLGGSQAHWF